MPAVNTEPSLLGELSAALTAAQRSGVVVQDGAGKILDFNDAALVSLAMTADQLRGVSSLDDRWEALDASGRPLAGEHHPAMVALATGEPQLGVTMGVRSGDGVVRWLLVDSTLFDHAELGQLVITQFLDRTDEVRARARTSEALDLLQRHVLPATQLDLPWVGVRHRYDAVTPPLDVGGDFLDVFELDDDSIAFFIGDVAGHDLDAVATMVIARHTLRAAGLHVRRPGRVLQWLHDTLVSTPDTVFCTCVFGIASRGEQPGDIALRFANGGHPAPVIRRCDGRVEALATHGRLIGAPTAWDEPEPVEATLGPGDELLLFTDGILDNQRPRLAESDLHDRLASLAGPRASAIDVVDDLLRSGVDDHQDDAAAVVIAAPRHAPRQR